MKTRIIEQVFNPGTKRERREKVKCGKCPTCRGWIRVVDGSIGQTLALHFPCIRRAA